ncbi:unnamed protein product [Miscanthus lutarioriparius]|uniref:Cyclopropane-fatty-acyl-phospholipid synthase n=1 Tax=Miscanthus lutarioriparius TaxID=422564 RepID=A0A811QG13_9POAL|nr:unnamed protein product [Miscanthus lutarioriparius]
MYDRIILGINAQDAVKVLGAEATHEELKTLGAFQYMRSNVYVHCDESLMPHNSSAWSARNFLGTTSSGVCVTSWLNILQLQRLTMSSRTSKERGEFGSVAHVKAATEGDLGFASAYIHGYISFVDHRNGLVNLVRIILATRCERKRLYSTDKTSGYTIKAWWAPLLGISGGVGFAKYFLRHAWRKNSVSKAPKNISEHYDLSILASGIFKAEDESLEAAQLRTLDSLINKAKVESGHHVLDIGCGWGTLAIRFVKKTGYKFTGITLSEEQLKYAKRKVKESGLEDRITLLLCDYRQIPNGQKFDRIISCEMLQHVGHEYYEDFFASCEYHLAEHGIFVLQTIALVEEMYDKMRLRPEFVKTYIFPGGCLPSLGRIVSAMTNASRLKKASALGFDEKFICIWEYYLGYCAALFKSRITIDYQIVFARPGDSKLPSYVAIA